MGVIFLPVKWLSRSPCQLISSLACALSCCQAAMLTTVPSSQLTYARCFSSNHLLSYCFHLVLSNQQLTVEYHLLVSMEGPKLTSVHLPGSFQNANVNKSISRKLLNSIMFHVNLVQWTIFESYLLDCIRFLVGNLSCHQMLPHLFSILLGGRGGAMTRKSIS